MQNRSIYVVGPSSTGKTTLCNALSIKFGLPHGAFTKEIARSVIRANNFTRADVGRLETQEAILSAQLAHEAETFGRFPLRLFDRSAIDPIVYAVLTASSDSEAEERKARITNRKEFQQILPLYRNSLFVLLGPVREWMVDDGVRHLDNQVECWKVFRSVLQELEVEFGEIQGDMKNLDERIAFVMRKARL